MWDVAAFGGRAVRGASRGVRAACALVLACGVASAWGQGGQGGPVPSGAEAVDREDRVPAEVEPGVGPRRLSGPLLAERFDGRALDTLDMYLPGASLNHVMDFSGNARVRLADAGVDHPAKVRAGENLWTGHVAVRTADATQRAVIAHTSDGSAGLFVLQDGRDLVVAVVEGARWAELRVVGVCAAGQTIYGQWRYSNGAFTYRPGINTAENNSAAGGVGAAPVVTQRGSSTRPVLRAASAETVVEVGGAGSVPATLLTGVMSGRTLTGAGWVGSLALLASQTHETRNGRTSGNWWPQHAWVMHAKGYRAGDVPGNRGVGPSPQPTPPVVIGTGGVGFSRLIDRFSTEPERAGAVAGDLSSLGAWLASLRRGEEPVVLLLTDSTGLIQHGGLLRGLMDALSSRAAADGLDGRPNHTWNWLSTLASNSTTQGDQSWMGAYGLAVTPRSVRGFVPQATAWGSPQGFEAAELLAFGDRMITANDETRVNTLMPVTAFSIAAELGFAVTRTGGSLGTAGLYAPRARGDRADDVSEATRSDTSSGGYVRQDLLVPGDVVSLAAVVMHRESAPGRVQFAVQCLSLDSNGAVIRTPVSAGGRLATRVTTNEAGYLSVDAGVRASDAARLARFGEAGMLPLRPATLDARSVPTPLLPADPSRFGVARSQPWVMGEIDEPAREFSWAESTLAVTYQPRILLDAGTALSVWGVRLHGVLDGPARRGYEVFPVTIGGTTARDHAGYFWPNPDARAGVEPNTGMVRHLLSVMGAAGKRVLFVYAEDQNSGLAANGTAIDALNDASNTWCGHTGAVMRAAALAAQQAGASGVAHLRFTTAEPRNDGNGSATGRTAALVEMARAGFIDGLVAVDPAAIVSQEEYEASEDFLHPHTPNGLIDEAHAYGSTYQAMPLAAVLSLAERAACGAVVDADGDGEATVSDLYTFLGWMLFAEPAADLDADGAVTFFDLMAYLREYDGGCR